MKKKLRIIAVVAVVGAIAIVAAQQGIRSAGSAGRSGASGTPVASAANDHPYENSVIVLLSQYFCRSQDYEIEKAKAEGRSDLIQPIIKANCSSNIAMMRPEMQKREIAGYQIETYAPKDRGWDAVAATPSLVNHLLKISPAAEKVAIDQIDWVWSDLRADTNKFMAYLESLPEYRNASTKHEKNLIMYREDQRRRAENPPRPKIEMARDDIAQYEQALAITREALTVEQQKEFDMLIARFKSNMKSALSGTSPFSS